MSNDDLDRLLSLPHGTVFHVMSARFVRWYYPLPTLGFSKSETIETIWSTILKRNMAVMASDGPLTHFPSLLCFDRFTFAKSLKPDLWTCVCVFTFSSSVFAFLIEKNFSFKSLSAIWSFSSQRFHYYFYPNIVSWKYQNFWTILRHLCVMPLVGWS